MEKKEFLPLGSVVIVKGNIKKLMLVSRAVFAMVDGKEKYFDYGACTYPEGIMGANLLYFCHEDIGEVVYSGFVDEDEERMLKNIHTGLKRMEEEKNKEEVRQTH